MVCKQRNKTSDGLHVIYRYLLAVNQTIGSQLENLIYNDICDILLETFLFFQVFVSCSQIPEFSYWNIFGNNFGYI